MTGRAAHDGTGAAAGGEPAGGADGLVASLLAAVATVDALRERDAWNAAQTHASLARYALEEGHEVAAAAEAVGATDDTAGFEAAMAALRDELGDLLWQVVLHARLAAEREDGFDLADVAASLVAKARRRHPHVFTRGSADGADGDRSAAGPAVAELEAGWEALKDADRAGRHPLDDLPASLPALVRAQKVLALAERAGLPPAHLPARSVPDGGIGQALLDLVEAARRAGLDAEQELRTTVLALEDAVRAAPPPRG